VISLRQGLALLPFLCWGCVADEPPPRPPSAAASPLIAPGESLYARGEFDSARVVWRKALAAPGIAGTADEARLHTWLGLAGWRVGEYAEARQFGERGLELARGLGLEPEVAQARNALGLLAWHEGRLADAADLFEAALASFTASGDGDGITRASNNLGLVRYDVGRFEEARAAFTIARDSARARGNSRSEGRVLTNLGMLEIWTGELHRALDLLALARARAGVDGDVVGLANALGQTGVAYMILGQPGQALAALDSALLVARTNGMREEEANDLVVVAGIYADAGAADRALQAFADARTINQQLGLAIETGTVLREEAMLRATRGATGPARRDVLQAIALHRTADARGEELLDLLVLADIELRRSARAPAEERLREAHRLAEGLGSPQARLTLALTEARVADELRDPGRALRILAAVNADLPYGGPAAHAEAHALRLRAWTALDQLDSAVAAGRRAVAAIETVRDGFASGPLRTSYVADRSRVYADLVVALLAAGDSLGAFAVADAARGRAIIEHLSAARANVARGTTLRELQEAERLLRRIDQLLSQLAREGAVPRDERGPAHAAVSHELMQHLERARSDYAALLVRLAERSPSQARLVGTRGVTGNEVRRVLGPDEALLELLTTGNGLFLFLVTRSGVHVSTHAIGREELVHQVQLARELLASPAAEGRERAVTGALHQLLIGPFQSRLSAAGVRHLLIVPHGALSYLPFAALRDPATDRILAEDYAISTLPSAGVLPLLRNRSTRSTTLGASAFAPFPVRLPSTAAEIKAVSQAVPRTSARAGAQAGEAAVRRALAQGRLVHIASHGVMNARNPLFSRIELARGRNGSSDDGRLEVHELLDLEISSPLVFLSGCQTGLGSAWTTAFDVGEDYATLAQAFLLGAGTAPTTGQRTRSRGHYLSAGRKSTGRWPSNRRIRPFPRRSRNGTVTPGSAAWRHPAVRAAGGSLRRPAHTP
jgi:CHAT domain-containing protein/tetratricopeptide (TPR) repeat protein